MKNYYIGIIKIHCKLSFKNYMGNICKKMKCICQRRTKYEHKRCLIRKVFLLQFNYCTLKWMFHNKLFSHKIDRLHERVLHVIYVIHSSYDEWLNLDISVSINNKDLQTLGTEMFRVYTVSAMNNLYEMFHLKLPSSYNLRN